MSKKLWEIVEANLLNGRVVWAGFLLLAVVFIDFLFLHEILHELDILEHFLFGFVLSEFASNTANSLALEQFLTRKSGQNRPRRVDLLIRLLGFLFIGGLLWEASERFLFPAFGSTPESFFSFPITLTNIDGTIDVIVGAVGCFVAWYLAKSRPLHTSKLA